MNQIIFVFSEVLKRLGVLNLYLHHQFLSRKEETESNRPSKGDEC
jgi:hypothetical protein